MTTRTERVKRREEEGLAVDAAERAALSVRNATDS